MIRTLPLALSLLCLFAYPAFSQNNDFESWNSLELETDITKRLSFSVEQELRLNNNATSLSDYVTQAGFSYELNNYIRLKGYYRFALKSDDDFQQEYEQRIIGDLWSRYEWERFSFYCRLRYQMSFIPEQYAELGMETEQHFRQRFSLKYNVPKTPFTPFFEAEYYYILSHPIENYFDKSRYTLGFEHPVIKNLDAEVYFRYQQRRAITKKALDSYILGIGFTYEF